MRFKVIILAVFIMLILGLLIQFPMYESQDSLLKNKEDVNRTRATLYVGLGQPYTKIQDAVDAANSGDSIRVYAGTFNEQVKISKTSGAHEALIKDSDKPLQYNSNKKSLKYQPKPVGFVNIKMVV